MAPSLTAMARADGLAESMVAMRALVTMRFMEVLRVGYVFQGVSLFSHS